MEARTSTTDVVRAVLRAKQSLQVFCTSGHGNTQHAQIITTNRKIGDARASHIKMNALNSKREECARTIRKCVYVTLILVLRSECPSAPSALITIVAQEIRRQCLVRAPSLCGKTHFLMRNSYVFRLQQLKYTGTPTERVLFQTLFWHFLRSFIREELAILYHRLNCTTLTMRLISQLSLRYLYCITYKGAFFSYL